MDVILKNRGNYKELLTFKKATVIFDLTYYFCHKYLSKGDRTIDQMIQAARSGKQNIAEGVAASSTAAETEIRLVNVAKASLKELLTDFEDYLRTRRLRQWEKDGKEIAWLRNFARQHEDSAPYLDIAEKRNDEVVANMARQLQNPVGRHRRCRRLAQLRRFHRNRPTNLMATTEVLQLPLAIMLLKQEDYLLYRQLEAIEREFKEKGDLKVRMKPVAKEALAKNRDAAMKAAQEWGKKCPKCGKAMEDGSTYRGGVFESKWKCPKCGTEVPANPDEIILAKRAWYKRVWELKGIYGY